MTARETGAGADASCIFCKIIGGEIPSPRVAENDEFIVIRDIHPQAPVHLLVIPKEHFKSLDEAFPEKGPARTDQLGRMMEFATRTARKEHLLPSGFRMVMNTGHQGGQTVFHIHAHILGGDGMGSHFGS